MRVRCARVHASPAAPPGGSHGGAAACWGAMSVSVDKGKAVSVDKVPRFACKTMTFDVVLGFVRVKKWATNVNYMGIVWDVDGRFRAIKLEVRRPLFLPSFPLLFSSHL